MKNISKFQLIFLSVCILALIAGIAALALTKASSSKQVVNIVLWGTMPENQFNAIAGKDTRGSGLFSYTYVQKDPTTMYQNYLESVASGMAPDGIIITQDQLYQYHGKVLEVPFQSYSERTYKDSFIQGTEIFLSSQGVDAFPFAADPLVMYWNRDIFNAIGSAKPPQYWDEMAQFAQTVTTKDQNLNISRSAIGLGEYNNISHAKDILATLMYQAGGRVTYMTTDGLVSGLNNSFGNTLNPAQASVDFFTQFADPQKSTYTWNRTLPTSKDAFVAGDLALYIGFASEANEIRAKNPNLNFDVASVPQARGVTVPTTYADYWVVAIMRNSVHSDAVFSAITILTNTAAGNRVVANSLYVPVRRDILDVAQGRADTAVYYDAAFKSRSWIDPNTTATDGIFSDLINRVTSGRLGSGDAVSRAHQQLSALLNK